MKGGAGRQAGSEGDGFAVIPAKAGIQENHVSGLSKELDSRLRGNDGFMKGGTGRQALRTGPY